VKNRFHYDEDKAQRVMDFISELNHLTNTHSNQLSKVSTFYGKILTPEKIENALKVLFEDTLSSFKLAIRDLNTDILALTNIGKRISGNNEITLQFMGNTEAVFTDCRFIYLPSKYKSDIKSAQGLVAHESGHIGYGSFELEFVNLVSGLSSKYNLPHFFTKNLINVVEDVRINAINDLKFPGFFRNLRLLTIKMLPKLNSRIENARDILLYINLYFEDYKGFQVKPKIKSFELSDDDWAGISKIKNFLFKSLTPSSSIISCDLLCKILKKYFTREDMEQIKQINSLRGRNNSTIDNIEKISNHKKQKDKTKLDKTSQELIDKLRNFDLEPKDLDKLIENETDTRKKIKKKYRNKKNKNKNRKNSIEEHSEQQERGTKSTDVSKTLKSKKINKTEQKVKNSKLEVIARLVKDSENAMKERLILLEKGEYMINPFRDQKLRTIKDTKIERESMVPDGMLYSQIKAKYMNLIKRMRSIFADLKNKAGIDSYQKKGKLNSKFIKAVTSDYKFKQCFTRKLLKKELKLLVLVDVSGSMRGTKIQVAKIALVILCEALQAMAKIRIVLFTGTYNALNILVKDFDETLIPRTIDKFGCHAKESENIDGLSIKHEANKLNDGEFIIVISDGQPAAQGGYNLNDAIPDIHFVRKNFKVFAFSIDSQGDYLNKMYGNDWVLTSSKNQTDLGKKMIKFCQIITREFFG